MARPESDFPTIADVADRLAELVAQGLGDLPAQLLVVPDSTMQAIARAQGWSGGAALMIELPSADGRRIPVSIMSTDRMMGGGMPSLANQ